MTVRAKDLYENLAKRRLAQFSDRPPGYFSVDFTFWLSILRYIYGVSGLGKVRQVKADQNSTQTDQLLERVCAGDVEAVDKLISNHRSYLRKLIDLRMEDELRVRVDPSDVAEVLQLDAATSSQRYGRALRRLREKLLKTGMSDGE